MKTTTTFFSVKTLIFYIFALFFLLEGCVPPPVVTRNSSYGGYPNRYGRRVNAYGYETYTPHTRYGNDRFVMVRPGVARWANMYWSQNPSTGTVSAYRDSALTRRIDMRTDLEQKKKIVDLLSSKKYRKARKAVELDLDRLGGLSATSAAFMGYTPSTTQHKPTYVASQEGTRGSDRVGRGKEEELARMRLELERAILQAKIDSVRNHGSKVVTTVDSNQTTSLRTSSSPIATTDSLVSEVSDSVLVYRFFVTMPDSTIDSVFLRGNLYHMTDTLISFKEIYDVTKAFADSVQRDSLSASYLQEAKDNYLAYYREYGLALYDQEFHLESPANLVYTRGIWEAICKFSTDTADKARLYILQKE